MADGFANRSTDQPSTHHLLPLYRGDLPYAVELHHRLLVEPHPYVVDLDGLHARARPFSVAGVETLVLAPEDGAVPRRGPRGRLHRYRYFPLRGLVDLLAMTVSWQGEIDWDRFVRQVRQSRASGAVFWPLRLSQRGSGAGASQGSAGVGATAADQQAGGGADSARLSAWRCPTAAQAARHSGGSPVDRLADGRLSVPGRAWSAGAGAVSAADR